MEFSLKRSSRKTLAVSFSQEGTIIVRAPLKMSDKKIHLFLQENKEKIILLQKKQTQKTLISFEMVAQKIVYNNAVKKIKQRFTIIQKMAKIMELETSSLPKFKLLRSRWGSCDAKGNITINVLLGLLPEALIDAVIAHEFCHIKEMNHSKKFYDLLLTLYPDYRACDAQLKTFSIKRQ
jgi:predicted metal-dependent hydrolase